MLTGEDVGLILDKYDCPHCHGHGCENARDTKLVEIGVNSVASSCRLRGRVGDVEGDGFSGFIARSRGKVVHYQQAFEVDPTRQ
jgi:hypothetical protein